ncbi:MAG: hypothetical protein F6K28_52440, partial [Microcoleus sp. SIO2G3]|nr:hypothetical protein [Microcoleus sp. SIO2G3]
KYAEKTASNPDTASVSPIRQLFDTIGQESPNPDTASVSPIGQKSPNPPIAIRQGDKVEILDGQFVGKQVFVEFVEDGTATVRGKTWHISRAYRIDRLRLVKRSEGES